MTQTQNEDEPLWSLNIDIIGFEDEAEDEDAEDEDAEEETSEDEEDESEDEDEDEDETQPDLTKLQKALRSERKLRRQFERENKKLKRVTVPPKKTGSGEQQEEKSEEKSDEAVLERAKSEKLVVKLRDQAIDNAITRVASRPQFAFRDIEDVLQLIERGEIDVDQDDDDPSEIEVDEESVLEAVKALAKKKPHLRQSAEDRSRSASKFGGKRKDKDTASDDVLRDKYPALRR